jgi:hypothetical protein
MPVDITEYYRLALDNLCARVAAGVEPSTAVQQIAVSGVSAACAADFNSTTKFVRVHTDVTVRIAFGKTPTASATSQRMVAGATEYFGVTPGIRMAAITSA